VEFAIVLPVFFLLLFGLIDGGRLVFLNSTLSQAAREAARVGSVEAAWIGSSDAGCGRTGGPVCPATLDALRADLTAAANRMIGPFSSIASANVYVRCDATTPPTGSWTGQSCTSTSTGNLVSVRVVYTFTAITPVIGAILGSVPLSGSATMVIN
jgi:hypothetical protein